MAAAPVTADEETSDLRLTKNDSVEADLTIAKLSTSKTSPPAPFTPSTPPVKRKRLKPARYDVSSVIAEKKRSHSKLKVLLDPSNTNLSPRKEKDVAKDLPTPAQTAAAMVRAGEVQSSLGTDHPSFVKTMVRSHVTSCFWMGVPVPFCNSFLPKNDTSMVVEDENGQQYNLKFIAYKSGLSAGWRNFAVSHNLLEGDALVFQLVESCKFKVYIIRAHDPKESDIALDVSNHNMHTVPLHLESITPSSKANGKKRLKSPPSKTTKKKRDNHPTKDGVGLEVPEGSAKPDFSVKQVKTFKDFRIMVNGQCVDSELSEDIRMSYYKLCVHKNEFLHDGVPRSLYYKLVAGMIGETVNISNEIKNCKITTAKEEFETLDNSLKSFELLGMRVGFLRDKIRLLVKIVFESEDVKRYMEAKEEGKRVKYAIGILETEILELKERKRKMDLVVGGLKEKAERSEIEFLEKVNAPW